MSVKYNFTPEQRAAAAARLRALWNDPEFRAKREAAVKDAIERNRRDGKTSKKKSAATKAAWADPVKRARRLAAIRKRAAADHDGSMAALFARLKASPEFEAKRLKKHREYMEKAASANKARVASLNRKRRGFDVPARLWREYQYLRLNKKMRAREAGLALGLVRN